VIDVGALLRRASEVLPITDGAERHEPQPRGDREPSPPLAARVARQLVEQIGDRRVAQVGVDEQPAQQDLAQPRGHPRVRLARRLGHLAADHRHRQARQRVGRERRHPVQRLVQRHAEAELIGARVGRQPEVLLRRHVRRRPEHRALLRQLGAQRVHAAFLRRLTCGRAPRLAELFGRLGQPEVEDLRLPGRRHQHVLWFEVAVHQPSVVRGLQPAAGHREHREHLLAGARLGPQPRLEGRSLDELHGDEHAIADLSDVVDRDHVRVTQARHRLRLAEQPRVSVTERLRALRARRGTRVQQLERDLAIQLRVVGGVHDPHAAGTERAEHDVASDPLSVADLLDASAEREPSADRVREAQVLARPRRARGRRRSGTFAGLHRRECTTAAARHGVRSECAFAPWTVTTWPHKHVRSDMYIRTDRPTRRREFPPEPGRNLPASNFPAKIVEHTFAWLLAWAAPQGRRIFAPFGTNMAAMSRAPVLWTCLFALGLAGSSCSAVTKVDYSECTESATCRDAFGLGWLCGDAGLCQEVEANQRCKETWPTDLFKNPEKYEDAILLGSLFDHTPSTGDLVLVNSASLAIDQANQTGLTDGRTYAIIHCGYQADSDIDDLTPEEAVVAGAKFLVDNYGTPVIIGPGTSSLAEAAFTELQKPEHNQSTLLISPSATSPSLTNIDVRDGDKPGLFWRTAPPDSLLGEVLASRMAQADADLGNEPIDNAAVIFTNDTYGQGLATELDKNFTGNLLSYGYDNSKNIASLAIQVTSELAPAGPNVGVVFIGSTVEDVVDFINVARANETFFTNVSIYLGDAAKNEDVLNATEDAAATIYPRIRGVFPGSVDEEGPIYRNFDSNYTTTFNGGSAKEASYSAHTYDATWLALYGTAWAEFKRDGKLTGLDIAYGLQQISDPNGEVIEVGALKWNDAKSEFKAGRAINVVGASGLLDYDPENEETKAPVEYWKINDAGDGFTVLP
jgi:hypothetical protein